MLEQLLLESLNNEVEFLLRLEDIEFLRELRPFLRMLELTRDSEARWLNSEMKWRSA